jgi:hypothetical protein
MNTVHRTSINRILNYFLRIAILAEDARTSIFWFDIKGIGRDVGAVSTANANVFIDENTFLPPIAAQFWLESSPFGRFSPLAPQLWLEARNLGG